MSFSQTANKKKFDESQLSQDVLQALQKADPGQPTQDTQVLKYRAEIDRLISPYNYEWLPDNPYLCETENYAKLLKTGQIAILANNYYFLIALNHKFAAQTNGKIAENSNPNFKPDFQFTGLLHSEWGRLLANLFAFALNNDCPDYAGELINAHKYSLPTSLADHLCDLVKVGTIKPRSIIKMVQVILKINSQCVVASDAHTFFNKDILIRIEGRWSTLLAEVMRYEARQNEPALTVTRQMLKFVKLQDQDLAFALHIENLTLIELVDQFKHYKIKPEKGSYLELAILQYPKWAIESIETFDTATEKQNYCQRCVKNLCALAQRNNHYETNALIIFKELAKFKLKLDEDDLKLLIQANTIKLLEYALDHCQVTLNKPALIETAVNFGRVEILKILVNRGAALPSKNFIPSLVQPSNRVEQQDQLRARNFLAAIQLVRAEAYKNSKLKDLLFPSNLSDPSSLTVQDTADLYQYWQLHLNRKQKAALINYLGADLVFQLSPQVDLLSTSEEVGTDSPLTTFTSPLMRSEPTKQVESKTDSLSTLVVLRSFDATQQMIDEKKQSQTENALHKAQTTSESANFEAIASAEIPSLNDKAQLISSIDTLGLGNQTKRMTFGSNQ